MTVGVEPIAAGLVASLAKPGANVTGLTLDVDATELAAKRLEILKELMPTLSRVAVLWNPGYSPGLLRFKGTEDAGRKARRHDRFHPVPRGKRRRARLHGNAGARGSRRSPCCPANPVTVDRRAEIIRLSARYRLPSDLRIAGGRRVRWPHIVCDQPHQAVARAADYVAKILKGAKPAELPIAQPTAFELWINKKAAKTIGIRIPLSLLAAGGSGDRVVERRLATLRAPSACCAYHPRS